MARNSRPEPKGPDWSPEQTLKALRKQHEELKELEKRVYVEASKDKDGWIQLTSKVIAHGFGERSSNSMNFDHSYYRAQVQDPQANYVATLERYETALVSSIKELEMMVAQEPPKAALQDLAVAPDTHQGISVFISHSSKDAALASALIDLLKGGLGLLSEQIRCSSVDGYRLPVGVNTESKLREEVNAAQVVIGLITPSSLSSEFVMFELGARWGAGRFLAPLLAGVDPRELRGPLSLLNALSCSNESQLHQLLKEIAEHLGHLGVPLQSVASYVRYVSPVMQLSAGTVAAPVSPNQEELVFEESVYWKRKNGQRKGPYCPTCYDNSSKVINLNPGATKGTYGCGVCKNSFRTAEYNASTSERRQRFGGPWS